MHFDSPELTLALALFFGISSQVLATHLRLPGIVVLLAMGVILGPDVLHVLDPSMLGDSIGSLVGFAVAVILFEGGMALDLNRIRRAEGPIYRLISIGALVTAVLATFTVRSIMMWDWGLSILFGALVIVTGPTVVTPLLRRLKVEHSVATVLEAEGVLIDPVGAIAAFVALEAVLHPSAGNFALVLPSLAATLGLGTFLGVAGGWLLHKLLQSKRLIPEDLVNIFTLAFVLAMYQIAESILHESGIAAVTFAGVAVAYFKTPGQHSLVHFKEQLTTMFIGMLFVLLAADVRIADIEALGMGGLATVAVLVVVVRPATVLISTAGSNLNWKQKAFLAYMGPRGIVAAAVASLFSVELDHAGMDGGRELRAMVFLVIAVTVVLAGLTGGLLARALGLRRKQNDGWVILGAHHLARTVGKALKDAGEPVLLVDVNPTNCKHAQEMGLSVRHGDALKDSTLLRLELDTRAGALAVTRNEEINFLFAQKAASVGGVPRVAVTLRNDKLGVTTDMLKKSHSERMFDREVDVDRWNGHLAQNRATTERWTSPGDAALPSGVAVLPLVVKRGKVAAPFTDKMTIKKGDIITLLMRADDPAPREALTEAGWAPVTEEAE